MSWHWTFTYFDSFTWWLQLYKYTRSKIIVEILILVSLWYLVIYIYIYYWSLGNFWKFLPSSICGSFRFEQIYIYITNTHSNMNVQLNSTGIFILKYYSILYWSSLPLTLLIWMVNIGRQRKCWLIYLKYTVFKKIWRYSNSQFPHTGQVDIWLL